MSIELTGGELTPWFDGRTKPVRAGLYLRYCPVHPAQRWSVWNGERWGITLSDQSRAESHKLGESAWQDLPWRGLALDPSLSLPEVAR